jgi:hypothetical protein
MKTLLLLLWMLCACGGPDKSESAEQTLEDVSLRWARAALGGNRAEATALSLTHAQFAAITTKTIEKAEYDEELGALIGQLAREGTENAGMKIVATKVGQKKTLPAGEKLRRETEIATVTLVIEAPDGKRQEVGMPMFFIRSDAGWRFSPKK